ncbi:MAG: transposase, partial [Pseudomonadota bacterium]
GWLRFRKSREVLGTVKNVTVSYLAPLNSFKKHQTALRKAQQAMSRKVKFSNNWKRAKGRVQKIQARIANARRDYL